MENLQTYFHDLNHKKRQKDDIQEYILYENVEILTTRNVKCLMCLKITKKNKPKITADVNETILLSWLSICYTLNCYQQRLHIRLNLK